VGEFVPGALIVALLAVGVVGALTARARVPLATAPVLAALVAVASRLVTVTTARHALDALVEPLAFLVFAVPLAVLLDELGVFDAAARAVSGRHVAVGCWLLGIVGVAVLNLDAAVVLLTPLYVRLARRLALDPVAFAFQPALLACLASCALPVSNLTNLIAVGQRDLTAHDFLAVFALPTLVACAAGYAGWRVAFRNSVIVPVSRPEREEPGQRELTIGVAALVVLLAGFLLGDRIGVSPWAVVAVVDVVLAVLARATPWRAVPLDAVLLAGGLAVLAAGVAARVDIGRLLAPGAGSLALARDTGVSALLANASNNLPAFLVLLPFTAHAPDAKLWAVLLGVNLGPLLLVTGSLSGLLWLTVARRENLPVGARDYLRVGAIAGLPALALATVTLIAMR
jgi:arsenical pump membrane protein